MFKRFLRRLHEPVRPRIPYVPGTLGPSAVSQDIQRDYGIILSRRERRQLARQGKQPFKPYYNV